MRHRQIIEGAAFDPTTLVEIGTAFDRAWSEIEHHFGETDADVARARWQSHLDRGGRPRLSRRRSVED